LTKLLTGFGGPGVLEFSTTATTLYGSGTEGPGNSLYKMAVDSAGVTLAANNSSLNLGNIKFSQGLLYSESGSVADPETFTLKGRFNAQGPFALDAANRRIYFLTGTGTMRTLRAFDLNTFVPLGELAITGVSGTPTSLLRWGTHGLAFRTSANQLFLIQSALVALEPVPLPAPTPTPLPAPSPITLTVRQVALPSKDLVYDPAGQMLYASVPSNAGARSNSLTPINPATGVIGNSVPIGDNPGKLAMANTGQTLYVALGNPATSVRRFNTATQSVSAPFSLGAISGRTFYAEDLKVAPGNASLLAVARKSDSDRSIAVYDNGTQLPDVTSGPLYTDIIEFGANASTLYAYNTSSSSFELYKLLLNANGVKLDNNFTIGRLIEGHFISLKFDSGLLYASTGRVVDPEARRLVGNYTLGSVGPMPPAMLPDATAGRVYFLTGFNTEQENTVFLHVFDLRTFLRLGLIRIPGVIGQATNLTRWGANGLAFRTSGGQVFLLQTSLIPSSNPNFPPAPASVSAASFRGEPLASGSIVATFGANLANATQSASTTPLPLTLANTQVSVRDNRGGENFAPLFFVSPSQINFYLPPLNPGPTTLTFASAGYIFSVPVLIEAIAPGLFAANANGAGVVAAVALRVKANGTQSFEAVARFDAALNRFVALPLDLGSESDQLFLVLFGTGFRNRNPADPITLRAGGGATAVELPVLFAGAQGSLVGLDQLNARLPRSLAGRGEVELNLTVSGKAANVVRVNIK
jgi:uncharacterized protein (TIGR03437 family)